MTGRLSYGLTGPASVGVINMLRSTWPDEDEGKPELSDTLPYRLTITEYCEGARSPLDPLLVDDAEGW